MAWYKRDFLQGSRSPTPGPIWDEDDEEGTGEEEGTPETTTGGKESDDDETPPQTSERKRKHSVSPEVSPAEDDPRVQKRARALDDGEEEEEQVSQKPEYSSFAQRMMAKMGHRSGEGLGKTRQGITDPITESLHKGRRGLGFQLEGLEREDVKWEVEEADYEQKPEWLAPCTLPVLTEEDLEGWMKIGKRKSTIEDETDFCEPPILDKILSSKTLFDRLSTKEFLDARKRSNPFETIKTGIFQNRAAMKMANIDAVYDFMFSSPTKPDGSELIGPNDILYFADLCAGPGGFSEYLFWRKKWHARGFGITLKDPEDASDFKLDSFLAGPCETFDPHYGEGGYDGTGDIMSAANLQAFQQYILEQTGQEGVHFVMADGGASVEGEENIQEILMKQLVMCQFLCALSILRTGGHFMCKIFDMFTPFTVGLIYLLYRCFEQVSLIKPVTSRPANSERYVVCRNLRPNTEAVYYYLFAINNALFRLEAAHPEGSGEEEQREDVLQVVPADLLREEPFFSYVCNFNNEFGLNQIIGLKKLRYYVKNPNLREARQSEIRENCLKLWGVPNIPRTSSPATPAPETFETVWKELQCGSETRNLSWFESSKFQTVVNSDLCDAKFLNDVHSWKWYFACGRRFLIVGLGRNRIHAWDMRGRPHFSPRREFSTLELPKGTVLEVELVSELTGEGQGQRKRDFVYIIDVLAVYEQVLGNLPLKERQIIAEKLCKVLNKPHRTGSILLKTKQYYRLTAMDAEMENLVLRKCKSIPHEVPTVAVSDESFVAPVGVVICKIVQEPWMLHPSKSGRGLYFFNTLTKKSQFDPPPSSVAPYLSVLRSRHMWTWTRAMFQDICGHDSFIDTNSKTHLSWSYLQTKIEQSRSTESM